MPNFWYDHWIATKTVRDSATIQEIRRLHLAEWGVEPNEGQLRHYLYRLAEEDATWHGREDLTRIIERQPVPPPPPPPTMQRLVRSGRWLRYEDGTRFQWQGMSAFGLLHRLGADEGDVRLFLNYAQASRRTVVRVFTACVNLFDLPPSVGRERLPRLCTLAAEHGLYVEAVALVDTALRQADWIGHLSLVRNIARTVPNLLVEGGNELYPLHATQDPSSFRFARLYPDGIDQTFLYAQGSSHNGSDESDRLAGGDYVTVHNDRADGEDGWRPTRHTKEGWNLSELTGKFVAMDEPPRDDWNLHKQFAFGALCRICGLGETFHYSGGLRWGLPTAEEQAALSARRAGWDAVGALDLDDGVFKNGHVAGRTEWLDSPVWDFDTSRILRCYSRINGNRGVTLALDRRDEGRIEFGNGWSYRNVLYNAGGAVLWEIGR